MASGEFIVSRARRLAGSLRKRWSLIQLIGFIRSNSE
jgi:hypothetical protein